MDPLKDVSVPEKKQAKFECTLTKEVSKVMWFRGAEIVTPGPKYEIIEDGRKHMLVINSCEFDDESQYSVEVSDKKSSAFLSVEGKCQRRLPFSYVPGSRCWQSAGVNPASCLLCAHLVYCRHEAQICSAAL